jgi:hypothetical protein
MREAHNLASPSIRSSKIYKIHKKPGRVFWTRPGDFTGVSNSQKDNNQVEKALILRMATEVPMLKSAAIVSHPERDASAACEQVVRRM